MSPQSAAHSKSKGKKPPIFLWILTASGGILGLFLAEPGNFWKNTVPSSLTFAAMGLVVGLFGWLVQRAMQRRT